MDLSDIKTILEQQGMKLLAGILILVVGLFLAHWLLKLLGKSERLNKIDPTLRGFLHNFVKLVVSIVIIMTAAGVMGVPLTSFVTILASASVAITLAMQGALSNFVGGITVLMVKLFRKGDYIRIGETEGTVQAIGVFYTELVTPDNRHISMPNNSFSNTAIVNYTREGTRRLDAVFSVSYATDLTSAKDTLMKTVARTENILPDPAPQVMLTQCADSSLNFTVRVWCKASDYWAVNWAMIENGKRALDEAGIEIPFPQVDVHMK